MKKYTLKRKSVLISGFLCSAIMSGSVLAAPIDFTASTHINRGTCTFSSGVAGLTFDFGNITPLEAFSGTKFAEQSFKLDNCVAVNNLTVSLSSTSTADIATGTYKGKWVAPATVGATGVAYKTEMKNGVTAAFFPLQADNKVPNTGADKYSPDYSIYIRTTLVPTVASSSAMVAGSLASTAVLNIIYQ